MFTVGTEHANLPPAQVGDAADGWDLSGLLSEISGNWPVALAGPSQIHPWLLALLPGPHIDSLRGAWGLSLCQCETRTSANRTVTLP